jgi:hypothetical protein
MRPQPIQNPLTKFHTAKKLLNIYKTVRQCYFFKKSRTMLYA